MPTSSPGAGLAGVWGGEGLSMLGVQAGTAATEAQVRVVFGRLEHPSRVDAKTGERLSLGSRPRPQGGVSCAVLEHGEPPLTGLLMRAVAVVDDDRPAAQVVGPHAQVVGPHAQVVRDLDAV